MHGGLVILLQQIINHAFTSTAIDYTIAEYLLRNLYDEHLTISKIAEACHISKASVTRFAQNNGYKGFNELKVDYDNIRFERDELKLDLRAAKKADNPYNQTQILQQEFDQMIKDLNTFNQNFDFDQVEKLSQLIYEANDVYIISTLIPEKLSQILQGTLLNSEKLVFCYPSINQQYTITQKIEKDDLALFVSLEGSYITQRDMTLSVTNAGATSALITQNPEMKLSSVFDHIITLGTHDEERSGKYKLLMFIEYFSHFYMRHYS